MSWLPIETVPKDGTCVLLYYTGTVSAGIYNKSDAKYPWFVLDDRNDELTNGWQDNARYGPSHWMPLPSPPEKTE